MNVGSFKKVPLQPLVLLWLAYAWLGWYLSVNHIVWLVGASVAALVLAVAWRSISWLERLIEFGSKTLVVVLVLSASIALIATWSLFSTFIIMPLATTLLAAMELRFAGFSKRDRLLLVTVLAGFGLTVGEAIDIVLLPSGRY
ncbi:hypothetical protein [Scytonema sp. HK-05]|uniref:hypothetical protein n=1 Tax=Scytonema sp. HK-05 TaxID=1137095 RepID=UPI0009358F1D|nr:hypothetical protein [Scytonema sp. HK-05]OKH58299.1 hypothetical protein NIES2130_15240 [Scytonema sp. HK-05]